VKLGYGAAVLHPLRFVDAQDNFLSELTQEARNIVVVRIQTGTGIHQKHDDISFCNRLLGLACHLVQDA
jgi:hypothetical protein